MTNLTGLDIDNNQLTSVPDFSQLTNLTELYLRDNQLTRVPDVSSLTQLKYLDLRDNPSICKDYIINYTSWPVFSQSQQQLDSFPYCPENQPPVASQKEEPLQLSVEMLLNQSRYQAGERILLDMKVVGKGLVDIYVKLVYPAGYYVTIGYPLVFSLPQTMNVYQSNVQLEGTQTYPIMGFTVPSDLPTGGYQACGILTAAGAKPHDQANWLQSHCVGFEVY